MITEAQNTTPPIDNHNWLGEPYAERRVLAGFLNDGELEFVYPHSNEWPSDVREHVAALQGAAHSLDFRTDAGLCDISNVEEPEALDVLGLVGRAIAAPIAASFSYCWVNIHNLIACSAIADPFPPSVSLSNDDVRSLAEYSLYEPLGPPLFVGTALATTAPVNLIPVQATLKNSQLVVRYQLSRVVKPIMVGYENNRCYLLKEYGRVLAAMAQGIDRLLCLVYYGLDLTQIDFKIRGLHAQGFLNPGEPINHFGVARLTSSKIPLVQDFLDPTVTAIFPSRDSVFIWQPIVQPLGVQFEAIAPGPLPLTGSLIETDANV
jgi:hypothetical protein